MPEGLELLLIILVFALIMGINDGNGPAWFQRWDKHRPRLSKGNK